MQRMMLKSKLHRVTVNATSITRVCRYRRPSWRGAIYEFEQVQIYDINNGNRLTTYAIKAPRGSGTISINGAAAHLARKGDLVIIASYSVLDEHEAAKHSPVLVYVHGDNSIRKISAELAGCV